MKVILLAVGLSPFFLMLNLVCGHVIRETNCPLAEDIEPCTCYPGNILECISINNGDTLRTVFENSNRYIFNLINISSSSFEFLPHTIFENTAAKNLILHKLIMNQLFDQPPRNSELLESIHIENIQISRQLSWDLLEHFTELRFLRVNYNPIKILDTSFSYFVPKTLEQLIFYGTETRRINPGVLAEYINLNKVAMDSCQLTTLTRDVFPQPFNVQVLSFNNNRFTSIPDDLFTNMPNLQTLSMRNNLISIIPQSAFEGGSIATITYAWFDGNPLKCDCLLQWITVDKPVDLRGRCAAPKRLHRRDLCDLETSDFDC